MIAILNGPATRCVARLNERVALVHKNIDERIRLVFICTWSVAVPVTVNHQAPIPLLRHVNAKLGAVYLTELSPAGGNTQRQERKDRQQFFHVI